jgi:hypothetical protein
MRSFVELAAFIQDHATFDAQSINAARSMNKSTNAARSLNKCREINNYSVFLQHFS